MHLRSFSSPISLHFTAIGYCQGMSYMAATLLMVMQPEDAFYTLVWMMERLDNVHDPKMSGYVEVALRESADR